MINMVVYIFGAIIFVAALMAIQKRFIAMALVLATLIPFGLMYNNISNMQSVVYDKGNNPEIALLDNRDLGVVYQLKNAPAGWSKSKKIATKAGIFRVNQGVYLAPGTRVSFKKKQYRGSIYRLICIQGSSRCLLINGAEDLRGGEIDLKSL